MPRFKLRLTFLKSGTIAILKNLEIKTAKLVESKQKLNVEVDKLNGDIEDLEAKLIKNEEEVLMLVKKEKVAKQSSKHLQRDLLTVPNQLKSVNLKIIKLKAGIADTSIDDEDVVKESTTDGKENDRNDLDDHLTVNTEENGSDVSMKTPSKVLPITTSPTVVATDNEGDSDVTGINILDESVVESADEFDILKEEEIVTNLEKVNEDLLEKVPRKKTDNSAGSSKENKVSTVMRGEEKNEEKEGVKRPANVDAVPEDAFKKRDENGTD